MTDNLTKVEYRVVPITRYQVLRYHEGPNVGGTDQHGTFDNRDTAYEVAYALASAEHKRLGWSPGDERIQYPKDDPRLSVAA